MHTEHYNVPQEHWNVLYVDISLYFPLIVTKSADNRLTSLLR